MKPQATLSCTRATLGGLLLAVAVCALFQFTPVPVAATQGATAQPTATPPSYWVRITHVKPGMEGAFRDLQINEALPALKKGGVKEHNVWNTAVFGEGYEYISVEPSRGLANLDEPNPMTKALGAEGARALNAKWSQLVADTRRFSVQLRPELCIPLKRDAEPKLAVVYRTKIAPFRTQEYEDIFKNFTLSWLRKGESNGFLMSKVGLGGDNNEYFGMFFLDSFAGIDKWGISLVKAGTSGGSGGAAPKLAGVVLSQESAVYRYVPELSIRPEAQKAAK
ncbi:MAG: hypothetical protein HY011_09110 [Acidobacteria bacterium]|nr:hypothetical protein [Acidobacteriota bacterium]